MPTFVPLFEEPGTGPNASPLPPANWNSIGIDGPGGLPEFDQLQTLNGRLTTTVEVQDDGQAQCTAVLPDNQYCSIQVKEMLSTSSCFLYLRGDAYLLNCLAMFIIGPLDGSGAAQYGVFTVEDGGGGNSFDWVTSDPINLLTNDVITFAVEGGITTGNLFVYQNNTLLFTGALNLNPDAGSTTPGGFCGLQLDTQSDSPDPADVGMLHFIAGSFSSAGPGGLVGKIPTVISTNVSDRVVSPRTSIMGSGQKTQVIG
jgi:hypothetical protein